ncbi:MAG: restriction endonuclease [Lachnospiraceae bacterium]|nr:restriction endonuclease [Lachnospiraceae bacterium]
MKRGNFTLLILIVAVLFTYWRGYTFYDTAQGEIAVEYALACAICLILAVKQMIKTHYLNLTMRKVDKLSGRAFEKYLRVQFRHLGYRVRLTESSHDYGADLVIKKRGEKIVVQAKRYEKNVGIAAVQEAVGSIAYYDADRAMVVTNSGFTKSARNLARQNDVELWGRYDIQKKFKIRD